MTQIGFKKFRDGARMPTRGTSMAEGWDLYACIDEEIVLESHSTKAIRTGLNIELPEGWYAYVQSRSGLSAKNSISVHNSPGLIDADYSGVGENFELKVILHNDGLAPYSVKNGDKVAQITFHKSPKFEVVELDRDVIPHASDRTGGLGSTG